MYIHILKPLEIRKEKEELTFKSQESTNCPNHQEAESRHPGSTTYDGIKCDVIVASSNSDDTLRDVEVNRLIARKRYVPRRRSLRHSVESFERPLRVYSRIVTFITLLLVMVRNVLGGLINIKRYERKGTVGNSSSLPLSGPLSASGFRELVFLYLRELSATILGINKELWPCLMIKEDWNANKRLKRRREVLHNTRIRGESSWYERSGYSHSYFHPRLLRAVITATTDFWLKSGSRILKLILCKKEQQITRDGFIFKIMTVNVVNIFRPVTAPSWLRNIQSGNVARRRFWRENG